VNQGSR